MPDGGSGRPALAAELRHDWTRDEVAGLIALPFPELLFRAQTVHRAHFDPRAVQISTLLSIKTGGCPEDCGYCSQSVHHKSGRRNPAVPAGSALGCLALAEGARPGRGLRDDRGREVS